MLVLFSCWFWGCAVILLVASFLIGGVMAFCIGYLLYLVLCIVGLADKINAKVFPCIALFGIGVYYGFMLNTLYQRRNLIDKKMEVYWTHGAREKKKQIDSVYVSASGRGKRYHVAIDCSGLKRSMGDIEKVSIEQAEEEGKTPCRICYKK